MNGPDAYTLDYRVLRAQGLESLVWINDELIDYVGGTVKYGLDGARHGPRIAYPYRFDAAVVSPSGNFIALYERLGTKAVIVGPEGVFREVNRSYYHAHVYEYPIRFIQLADGREGLVHCPKQYCEIQIEDPASGAPWTEAGSGHLQSMFHSRFMTNPAGTRLLSAGWVWQPSDVVRVFDIEENTDRRLTLQSCDDFWNQGAEIGSAIFNARGQLILASAKGADDFSEGEDGERLRPGMIGVYDLDTQRYVSLAMLEDDAGTLMPVGSKYVVGFYEHPKLIELASGRVVHRWPELKTGRQFSSILWHNPLPPPIAWDRSSRRFAVGAVEQITVVSLAPDLLTDDVATA